MGGRLPCGWNGDLTGQRVSREGVGASPKQQHPGLYVLSLKGPPVKSSVCGMASEGLYSAKMAPSIPL